MAHLLQVHVHICTYAYVWIYLYLYKYSPSADFICMSKSIPGFIFFLTKCTYLFITSNFPWHLPPHSPYDISCTNSLVVFPFVSLQSKLCSVADKLAQCATACVRWEVRLLLMPHLLPISKGSLEAWTSADQVGSTEQLGSACVWSLCCNMELVVEYRQ